jgi:hypothetical protein
MSVNCATPQNASPWVFRVKKLYLRMRKYGIGRAAEDDDMG